MNEMAERSYYCCDRCGELIEPWSDISLCGKCNAILEKEFSHGNENPIEKEFRDIVPHVLFFNIFRLVL